ncbi:MAG: hypothetical protein ACRDHY_17670, partial [Anaerolineales bacterium]
MSDPNPSGGSPEVATSPGGHHKEGKPRTPGAARWVRWIGPLSPFLAAAAALFVGALMLLSLGADPALAYSAMIEGAFGSPNALADTLVKATPLLFVGIGICVAFRGGVVNIGGEGQLIAGALAATLVSLT